MGKWVSRLAVALWFALTASGAAVYAEVDAVTTARHDLKLSFNVPGKVDKVPVKSGDRVEAGQLLIGLEDREGAAMIERLNLRINSDAEIKRAEARASLARLEEKRVRKVVTGDAGSQFELDRAELQAEIAELELAIAKQDHEDLKKQLVQAEARHDQYTMRAPTAGVVETLLVQPGEGVEPQKPVLRLVSNDPLWVDAFVPTGQTLGLKPGDPAWVKVKLPGHDLPVQGKVLHLARVADAGSDTRLVRVEIANAEDLPAGVPVKVGFTAPAAATAQAGGGTR